MKTPEQRDSEFRLIVQSLQNGRKVTDSMFDQVYPTTLRRLSKVQWTPVEVAIRAAELLVAATNEESESRVLDIGSGCGKFCLVGAITSGGQFTGVEQRKDLVDAAVRAKRDLGVDRARFLHKNMTDVDFSNYTGFYFFNPFFENIEKSVRIDRAVTHSQANFENYIETVRKKLDAAPRGTRIATYYGMGGDFPPCYELLLREQIGSSMLELWEK